MNQSIEHIETIILQRVNATDAWKYKIIPFKVTNNVLEVYAESESIQDELEIILGVDVVIVIKEQAFINQLLLRYYRKSDDSKRLKAKTDDLVYKIIEEAKESDSSDIHIEVLEDKARVRFRIDGKLQEKYILEKSSYPELVNKIKIKSKLQIAEKRLPQDGRMEYKNAYYNIDIRVSILPTLHGEKIVLRLLGSDAKNIHLQDLGMDNQEKELYLSGVDKSNGIVLISGPTGSGKTTTLYATLNYLNKQTTNITTIEDPIEYTLEGINQVQLKESIGLTFPNALRSFLRQDPDIIMVGEIRDAETANMAIRASLTGHLVLSTIHTNSAKGTISRLIDMGIPSFLIADTLNLSVAQRLVRLLCASCKSEQQIDINSVPKQFRNKLPEVSYDAVGCPECYYSGYKGRTAVFEIIQIDQNLKENIKKGNLSEALIERKHVSLADKCFELYQEGNTSLKEIYSLIISS